MSEAVPRRMGAWLFVWAASLLALTALAGLEGLPDSLRPHLAPGRVAVNGGGLLLFAVAFVLPLGRGGPARCAEDLALTIALAAPFAALAADWAPVAAPHGLPFLTLLASQAALALAASWAGAGRFGRVGTTYLVLVTAVLLGVPFLTYLIGETSTIEPIPARFASSLWAARPLLLDRAWSLPDGFWTPAAAVNLVLAAGFAAVALLGRRRAT